MNSSTYKRSGMALGAQIKQGTERRTDISDLTPADARALYLTGEQHDKLLDLIDQAATDRLNDSAECTDVMLTIVTSAYEALSLIAEGRRIDVETLLSNMVKELFGQYIIKHG